MTARLVLALLAVIFVVLAAFTLLPLWVGVLCLCAAVLAEYRRP